jgi:hypothetical protein
MLVAAPSPTARAGGRPFTAPRPPATDVRCVMLLPLPLHDHTCPTASNPPPCSVLRACRPELDGMNAVITLGRPSWRREYSPIRVQCVTVSAFRVLAACDIRGASADIGGQARWADVYEAGGFLRRILAAGVGIQSSFAPGRYANRDFRTATSALGSGDFQAQLTSVPAVLDPSAGRWLRGR